MQGKEGTGVRGREKEAQEIGVRGKEKKENKV